MKRLLLLLITVFIFVPFSSAMADVKKGDIVSFKLGKDQHGRKLDLKKLVGRTVVVYFWNPYSEECLIALEHLEDLQKRIPDEQLEVVAIAIQTDSKDYGRIKNKLANFESAFVYDKSGRTARQFDVYKPSSLFIIDAQGKINYVKRGYKEQTKDDLLARVNKLVNGG